MDLSRLDAFHPCSRDSLGDKGQFCFINRKKKKELESAPLTVFRLNVFQCNMATPKLFAYNLPTTITDRQIILTAIKYAVIDTAIVLE